MDNLYNWFLIRKLEGEFDEFWGIKYIPVQIDMITFHTYKRTNVMKK